MYKCKACGKIVSDEEYNQDQESGSGGYCYCEFEDGHRVLNEFVQVKWWEMLDWNHMKTSWENLSEEIKNDIRAEGLAPDYDLQSLSEKAITDE